MDVIDLNCDMGESFGAWTMGSDAEMLKIVSSANVASRLASVFALPATVLEARTDTDKRPRRMPTATRCACSSSTSNVTVRFCVSCVAGAFLFGAAETNCASTATTRTFDSTVCALIRRRVTGLRPGAGRRDAGTLSRAGTTVFGLAVISALSYPTAGSCSTRCPRR